MFLGSFKLFTGINDPQIVSYQCEEFVISTYLVYTVLYNALAYLQFSDDRDVDGVVPDRTGLPVSTCRRYERAH